MEIVVNVCHKKCLFSIITSILTYMEYLGKYKLKNIQTSTLSIVLEEFVKYVIIYYKVS